jgi:predicted O-linked N-acetylglucosamine transferase (SPINDLY family)
MATIPEALTLALQFHQAGRLAEAETLYRQILQVAPEHPDVLHLLGLIAHQGGQHILAVDYMKQALALRPDFPEAYNNLGNALQARGELAAAVAAYQHALALHPGFPEACNNLGNALKEQGQFEEAVACYQRALASRPSYAEAYNNLGLALQNQSKLEEAVAHFRKALAIRPGYAEALTNLGNVLREKGQLEEAKASCRQALKENPDHAEAHNSLGAVLHEEGRLDGAIMHYQKALAFKPSFSHAYNNLGLALQEQGQLDEAVACYRKSLELRPDLAVGYFNLGNALKDQGNFQGAVSQYRQALAIKPEFAEAEYQLMHNLQHLCEWASLEGFNTRQRVPLCANPSARISPFTLLTIPSSPAEQLACARNWVAKSLAPMVRLRHGLGFGFRREAAGRIRLGYLSADFRQHPVAHLVADLFELHDRTRFEVVAYSYGPEDGSEIRRRIAQGCDQFADLRATSFEEAARRIYSDGVHILVDLMGYTGGARTQILALRPAPIQVNYLGYPGTMGADFIDYIITDRFITPPDQAPFYAEQLVYLPDCYQVNDRQREIAEAAPSGANVGLPETGFVFCCFNNTYKITAEVFTIWTRLLQKLPASVLWLLEANSAAASNLRGEAAIRGVAPERLVFAPKLPPTQHLARHRLADLFLDTLPVNAHATCSDALWAGLPVLTCAGKSFVSRVAGSLLTAIGLPELITYSLEDYEARALQLATHPTELAALRERLEKNRLTAPLFDTPRFTRHLEMAYRMMWEIYLGGEPPRQIEVPALPVHTGDARTRSTGDANERF